MSRDLATQIQERIPPSDLETEGQVIGAMLYDSETVHTGLTLLTEDVFYLQKNRDVFAAIADLFKNDQPIDVTTVMNKLKILKRTGSVSGLHQLVQYGEAFVSSANFEHHCKILRKKATLRRLIMSCTSIAESAYRDQEGVADLLDRAEGQIFRVAEGDRVGEQEGLSSLSLSSLALYHEHADFLHGLPTGYTELDNLTNGLHRGDLFIIAGRPSMGKTAFALNMAEHICIEQNRAVGFFSLEMSREQLAERMLCGRAGLNSNAMKRLAIPADGFRKLAKAAAELDKAKLIIDDTPSLSEAELRAKARRMRARDRIDLVIVDYMQLMDGEGESRQQEITKISRGLKCLAKELAVPVVALSQLNRAVETRGGDKRPQLADLRESGAIEQDADVVCFVYRESHAFGRSINNRGEDISNTAEIIVAKQRSGPTGTARLRFVTELARFENVGAS